MPGRVFLKIVYIVLVLFIIQSTLVSCGGKGAVSLDLSAVKRVVVTPFIMNSPVDVPDGASVVTSLLRGMLEQNSSFELVSISNLPDAPVYNESEFPSEKFLKYVMEAGRLSGVDAVFCGRVNFFRQRVGGNYSVSMPASVSFDIILVSAIDGRILWRDRFDESQSSLSENILTVGKFVKRRGRWVTAEEIAAGGIEKLLRGVSAGLPGDDI